MARAVTGRGGRACEHRRMSSVLDLVVSGMALGRIVIGAAPLVAAGPASRLLGFPLAHDNATARLMARMFGVRDIGLGILALWGLGHPEALPFIFLFNALMDLGDLLSISAPLIKRQGIDAAALRSAAFAIAGGSGWLILWLIAR
jgi:hypothetical protein